MIRRAKKEDIPALAGLAAKMWSGTAEELAGEFGGIFGGDAAFFLCEEDGAAVAFAQCQIRRDYVEGTSGGPTGYLEGIYVEEKYRRKGIASALLAECERWAAGEGCAEFASDCGTENAESIAFHTGAGFREAARVVCFVKKIGRRQTAARPTKFK